MSLPILASLKFVQGAVAKKDILPALTHFRIEGGFVRSFNGALALCSPISLDMDCTPLAEKMSEAINQCEEPPTLTLTATNRLRLSSGRYIAMIPCLEGETAHVQPAGEPVYFDGEVLLQAIKVLLPFVGDDASRPWTTGILLRDHSAFATNNVCLVEYWLGVEVPFVVNLPRSALREMIRINEPPTHAQITKDSVTFHYTEGRWLRTQLLDVNWPDLRNVLDKPSNPTPVDPRLFNALDRLAGSADAAGRVYARNGKLMTHLYVEGEEELEGASYIVEGLGIEGAYQIKMLSLLKGVATTADFTRYPEPTLFFGERLRGAIIGMRM